MQLPVCCVYSSTAVAVDGRQLHAGSAIQLVHSTDALALVLGDCGDHADTSCSAVVLSPSLYNCSTSSSLLQLCNCCRFTPQALQLAAATDMPLCPSPKTVSHSVPHWTAKEL
jgi:hypothetical protein